MPGRPPPFTVMLHTWREHGKPRPWDKNDSAAESLSATSADVLFSSGAEVSSHVAGSGSSVPLSPRVAALRGSQTQTHGSVHAKTHYRVRSTPSLENLHMFSEGAPLHTSSERERSRTNSRPRFHVNASRACSQHASQRSLVTSRSSNSLDEIPQHGSLQAQRFGPAQRAESSDKLGEKQKQVLSVDSNLSRLCHFHILSHHDLAHTANGAEHTDIISSITRSPGMIASRAFVASSMVHADTFEDDSGDDFGTESAPRFASSVAMSTRN